MFEGEYLNDKRWEGKGYDTNNKIVSELKSGKGLVKEYYENGILKFEGEYSNGLKNGKGKEYTNKGKLKFEGEYLNGQRNGKGKEYYLNEKLKFEGEYLYNQRIRGKLYIKEKLEYEGDFLFYKKFNGKGYDENGNVIYELKNGNGKVKEYSDIDGKLTFEGEYINGKRNEKGKEFNENDSLNFEGEFKNGQKDGN